MFFNNPIERLRSEAQKVADFPTTLTRLQSQGSLSELASLLYSIYRCEYDSLYGQLIRKSEKHSNVDGSTMNSYQTYST